jgi:hypothetical protein
VPSSGAQAQHTRDQRRQRRSYIVDPKCHPRAAGVQPYPDSKHAGRQHGDTYCSEKAPARESLFHQSDIDRNVGLLNWNLDELRRCLPRRYVVPYTLDVSL